MAVSKALRFQIFRRDDHTCQYCGGRPPDVALRIDHVLPVALGGSDDPENLITSCQDCNSGKAATPPDAGRVAEVSDWNRRMAAEMQRLAVEAQAERDKLAWFLSEWNAYRTDSDPEPMPLPANWDSTVALWLVRGLTQADVLYAVRTAMGNDLLPRGNWFRYMAGVCWRMVSEREAQAAAALRQRQEPVQDEP